MHTHKMDPIVVRPAIAAAMLDCGLTTVYALIRAGKLQTIRVGADRRIQVSSIHRLAGAETTDAIGEPKHRRARRNKSSETKAA